MNARIQIEVRVCPRCKTKIIRKAKESATEYRDRTYCGRTCANAEHEETTIIYLGTWKSGIGDCEECYSRMTADIVVTALFRGRILIRRVCSDCLPRNLRAIARVL